MPTCQMTELTKNEKHIEMLNPPDEELSGGFFILSNEDMIKNMERISCYLKRLSLYLLPFS